eukprot:scaffold371069_cov39-Prasinocladus_malaysianus.AAC.2
MFDGFTSSVVTNMCLDASLWFLCNCYVSHNDINGLVAHPSVKMATMSIPVGTCKRLHTVLMTR